MQYLDIVGRNRPQDEHRLKFALDGLDTTPTSQNLCDAFRLAWWVARQSISPARYCREVRYLNTSLDRQRSDDPNTAAMFTEARRLLDQILDDETIPHERLTALVHAVIGTPGQRGLVVLVRDRQEVAVLNDALCSQLGVGRDDVHSLGVHVTDVFTRHQIGPGDAVVMGGYYGTHIIDICLASAASRLVFVLDPVEAKALYRRLEASLYALPDAVQHSVQDSLAPLLRTIRPALPVAAGDVTLNLDLLEPPFSDGAEAIRVPAETDEVGILFRDGSRLDVSQNSRFEVLGNSQERPIRGLPRLKSCKAIDLQPGDHVIAPRVLPDFQGLPKWFFRFRPPRVLLRPH